tara:strand:- start:42 stop:233 length:192 start_codon:yes stop_codon:yes gene_type:complete
MILANMKVGERYCNPPALAGNAVSVSYHNSELAMALADGSVWCFYPDHGDGKNWTLMYKPLTL